MVARANLSKHFQLFVISWVTTVFGSFALLFLSAAAIPEGLRWKQKQNT